MSGKQIEYGFIDERYGKFPPVVQLALVQGVCSSACCYCPMGMKNKGELAANQAANFADELAEKYFDYDLFKKIADEMSAHPFSILRIHSRGEPMCHPRYIDMICYAKKAGVGAVTSFTNGIDLKKHVDGLLAAPIDLLEISADAADQRLYEKWRRNPHFGDVVEGVKTLFSERNKRRGSPTKIVVSAVDHPAFRPHRAEFEAFWGPICDKVIVRPFHTYAGRIANPYRKEASEGASTAHIPCVQLWERFSISPDGLVNACFNDWGDSDVVGDLRQEGASIAGIWQNDLFHGIREASLRAPTLACCKECSGPSLSSWGKAGYQHWVRELLDSELLDRPIGKEEAT